jgi:hypothetical protein
LLLVDGVFQLRFAHAGPTFDPTAAGFFVKLVPRPASRAAVRTQATASSRRDVVDRSPAGLSRLAGAGTFLVHRAGSDLFG